MATVVITGASSGIGRALAVEYAGPDMTLGLLGRDEQRLAVTADACRGRNARVETAAIDVCHAPSMVDWLQAFDSRHAVDLMIANAGIVAGTGAGSRVEPLAAALQVIDVNLKGAIITLSALAQRMQARRGGHLAVISSLAGLVPQPDLPAYSASKAGLLAYGTALRVRLLSHGVAVSLVCPGYVDSPMLRRQHSAKPFTWSTERAARYIRRGLDRKRRLIAFPWQLALGIRLLGLAPPVLYDRILGHFTAEIDPDSGSAAHERD